MGALQSYTVTVDWTGATPAGTRSYRSYSRDHEIRIEGKPALLATSDRLVAADVSRYKAEELFVAAVSQAQMLWFLRTAARAGAVVVGYSDVATGTERIDGAGSGPFVEIVLRPRVHFAEQIAIEEAAALHGTARDHNHLARSLNFPVRVEPATPVIQPTGS